MHFAPLLMALLSTVPAIGPEPVPQSDSELVRAAGLSTEGPSLVEFVHLRARLEVDPAELSALADDLGNADARIHGRAMATLVMQGPVALPVLRRAAHDLRDEKRSARAGHCLRWIEGPDGASLCTAVIHLMAQERPGKAVEALLEYLPAADSDTIIEEVARALTVLAYVDGKPHPALLAALKDTMPLRRAMAGRALSRHDQPEQFIAVRPLLQDTRPGVRLRAALSLLAADDAEAVPVLIDLLPELTNKERAQAEYALQVLAGAWAPASNIKGEDEISRRIRRDAWAAWWRATDGPALLTEFRRRTLSPAEHERAKGLVAKLAVEDFEVRQAAADELVTLGPRVIPLLRPALQQKDAEGAQRAATCLQRIKEEGRPLPAVAVHLLAMRSPDTALETLLDYLPFAEDDMLAEEVENVLPRLALRGGELHPLLLRALEDRNPLRRAAAGEAIVKARPGMPHAGVHKLLADADPMVRLRAALVLAPRGDKDAIPVLINALGEEPSVRQARASDLLERLAGEKAPQVEATVDAAGRKKMRDAWAAWWKEAAAAADLTALASSNAVLGYTLLVDPGNNRVLEIGRDGKPRWSIDGLQCPMDACVLGNNRVLIAEYKANRVTERDFKGRVLWQKDGLPDNVISAQRLINGHTFIAMDSQLMEVDAEGKPVWSLSYNVQAAHKGTDGVITCLSSNRCIRLMHTGQEVSSFSLGRFGQRNTGRSNIDVLPTGHILMARYGEDKVLEFDGEGNVQWQATVPNCMSASRMANGHTLVGTAHGEARELDQSGKVVWEFKEPGNYYQVRRR